MNRLVDLLLTIFLIAFSTFIGAVAGFSFGGEACAWVSAGVAATTLYLILWLIGTWGQS